ncbi:heterokaryon incompatibility protein [Colletotrichum plurivorum]|uniref:Heterokaryon incompatibility protein n=1 Tax=Colletotrichum plurivorum TaxID=2175906 RepID=A0A8H6NB18_9PEZI|nr:heterokaryon incompatibility protein [Colletotrichum plurivorum]
MICSICQDALSVDDFHAFFITDKETKPHHLTYTSLKSSVDAGCYVCNRLWACLAAEERQFVTSSAGRELDGNDKPALGANQEADGNEEKPVTTIEANEGAGYGHAGSYLLSVSFNSIPIPRPASAEFRPHWRLSLLLKHQEGHTTKRHSLRTDSLETLLLAKRWVTECVETHDQCKASRCTDTGWYPTRLIDCGPPGEERPRCRLITTKDVSLNEPYMTLSHCWGRVECLSLTAENHDLLRTISPSKTYHYYARKPYALPDISASDVFGSIHYVSSSKEIIMLTGDTRQHYRFWEKEVSHALINTRAWVFQERLLSPRVLHFGERQILWECENKDAAEIHPEDLPVDLSWTFKRFKGFALDDTAEAPGDLPIYLYRTEIVKAYTACKLTFPSDKLIALSAVAKRMTGIYGDEYVAGMWRRYLERELIWSVSVRHADRRARPTRTPPVYRAPSWSWAATDGRINPGLPDVDAADILIQVHDFNLDYATSDRMGLVTGGWLRLWGVLKPLLLTAYHSPTAPSDADWEMAVNGNHVSVPSESWAREPQPYVLLDGPRPNFDE